MLEMYWVYHFDVEVEAKAKEAAIFALRDLEPTLE
jgi:hypothetical protein